MKVSVKILKSGKWGFQGINCVDLEEGQELSLLPDDAWELVNNDWAEFVGKEIKEENPIVNTPDTDEAKILDPVVVKGKRGWYTVDGVKVRAKNEKDAIEKATQKAD